MSDIEWPPKPIVQKSRPSLQEICTRAAEKAAARRAELERPPVSDIEWTPPKSIPPKSRNGKNTGLSEGSKAHWFGPGEGGRKKGVPNKVTRILKEAILIAAEQEAGSLVNYLRRCARHERNAYLTLLGKLLPLQVIKDEYSNVVYRSVQEVNVALNGHGLSVDVIDRLKHMNVSSDDVENADVQESAAEENDNKV
jgi:hypothetical protein